MAIEFNYDYEKNHLNDNRHDLRQLRLEQRAGAGEDRRHHQRQCQFCDQKSIGGIYSTYLKNK